MPADLRSKLVTTELLLRPISFLARGDLMRGVKRGRASGKSRGAYPNSTFETCQVNKAFVNPAPPVVPTPDFAAYQLTCDRPTRNEYSPQVPNICPSGLRHKAKHFADLVLRIHCTEHLRLKKPGRSRKYVRLWALRDRPGQKNFPVQRN